MKYIDADNLIAEIRRIVEEETPISKGADYYHGVADAADKLLSFIASLQQDQPEVDFETEYAKFSNDTDALDYAFPIDLADYKDFARHFYNLRNAALEKAAQHAYESWMGGTMDDVRRDMVELGKVLNARKEK